MVTKGDTVLFNGKAAEVLSPDSRLARTCPNCKRGNIIAEAGNGMLICDKCGHVTDPDKKTVLSRLDIRENLSDGDTLALKKLTKVILLWKISDVRIVEVGSWKGWSTQLMASLIKPHGGMLYAVDNWRGSADDWNVKAAREQDIFGIFRYNMRQLDLMDVIHPLVMDSMTAAGIFRDNSVDMVFIDANHRLQSTKDDITHWMPKIRSPGIICGHDCEGHYVAFSKEQQEIIDNSTMVDVIKGIGHPGVIKALHDVFDDNYLIIPGSRIWYHIKI